MQPQVFKRGYRFLTVGPMPSLGPLCAAVVDSFCSEQHLQRYLNEFQFRHNHRTKLGFSDGERTAAALKGIEGRRLTYRPTN